MQKYMVMLILSVLIGSMGWLYLHPREIHVVEALPKEVSHMVDDMARLALDVGDYDLAKKYVELSDNQDLKTGYQHRVELKDRLLVAIETGLSHQTIPTSQEKAVFKRLVSVESVEEVASQNTDVVTLLLLAKLSVDRGFSGWDVISKQLMKQSQVLEHEDAVLSELLYAMSQEVV